MPGCSQKRGEADGANDALQSVQFFLKCHLSLETQLIVNYHYFDQGKNFAHHDKNRTRFQHVYAELLSAEPALGNKVLDIGCGHGTNPTLEIIKEKLGHVDGVDPFPVQQPHPLIKSRWTCSLEDLPVPDASYDMAYSYNVVEHVENVDSFLGKVAKVVKPGGVYWSMAPNAHHPFSIIVLLLQLLRLKSAYRTRLAPQANNYPAYYRLCSDHKILAAIERQNIKVAKLDFYYVHCVHWDKFFPPALRFIPHLIDSMVLLRVPRWSSVFLFRLELEK